MLLKAGACVAPAIFSPESDSTQVQDGQFIHV